jgi:hypothetical protein
MTPVFHFSFTRYIHNTIAYEWVKVIIWQMLEGRNNNNEFYVLLNSWIMLFFSFFFYNAFWSHHFLRSPQWLKLTVTEYLCLKWTLTCCVCGNHNPVISTFTACHNNNTTGTTSGAETAYRSGAPEFTLDFYVIRVALSLVLL